MLVRRLGEQPPELSALACVRSERREDAFRCGQKLPGQTGALAGPGRLGPELRRAPASSLAKPPQADANRVVEPDDRVGPWPDQVAHRPLVAVGHPRARGRTLSCPIQSGRRQRSARSPRACASDRATVAAARTRQRRRRDRPRPQALGLPGSSTGPCLQIGQPCPPSSRFAAAGERLQGHHATRQDRLDAASARGRMPLSPAPASPVASRARASDQAAVCGPESDRVRAR